MITIFKIFEQENRLSEVGDYVICQEDGQLDNFLANNIGTIVRVPVYRGKYRSQSTRYLVRYKNIPNDIEDWFIDGAEEEFINCRRMYDEEIIYFSKNKEDVKAYIQLKKYNL